jgi:hypothetical protein
MPSAAFFGSPPPGASDAPPPSLLLPGRAVDASTPLESPASMREAPTHTMPACRQAGRQQFEFDSMRLSVSAE